MGAANRRASGWPTRPDGELTRRSADGQATSCQRCGRSSSTRLFSSGGSAAARGRRDTLIEDGGSITIGADSDIACVAAASDVHNSLAMLVRRDGEPLTTLLKRLDQAIGRYYDTGETTDEIN